ncbi:MAG: DMT family transporter [Flavobacteriales bacterium]|nr:DMT family transporter [Flavobacteriales bacterium]
MKSAWPAHVALLIANIIYGVNYSIAKIAMPEYVDPFGFVLLRAIGAVLFFWTLHFFVKQEKIAKADYFRFALCAVFGVCINQLMFLKGLNLSTPINTAIIMTTNPIMVLLIANYMIKERITTTKIAGILVGLAGALLLLCFNDDFSFGSETIEGDLYVLGNSLSYGIYLSLVKGMIEKYNPLTVVKWVFTFGICFVIPFGIGEVNEIDWSSFDMSIWGSVLFVVFATTCLAYFLNTFALTKLTPSVASTYIYLQPMLAAMFAVAIGKDDLDTIKVVSCIIILFGVYLVSKPVSVKE